MVDQGKRAAIMVAGLLFGAGVIAIAAPTNQAQQDWDPADPRNGTTVTGVVEVAHAGNARGRYKDTGPVVYQNFASVRTMTPSGPPSVNLGLYIFTTNRVDANSLLRVIGLLSIDKYEQKGGTHAADILVIESQIISSNHASQAIGAAAPQPER